MPTKIEMQIAVDNAYAHGKVDGVKEQTEKALAINQSLSHPIARRFNDITDLLINKGVSACEAVRHAVNLCSLIDAAKEGAADHGKASS